MARATPNSETEGIYNAPQNKMNGDSRQNRAGNTQNNESEGSDIPFKKFSTKLLGQKTNEKRNSKTGQFKSKQKESINITMKVKQSEKELILAIRNNNYSKYLQKKQIKTNIEQITVFDISSEYITLEYYEFLNENTLDEFKVTYEEYKQNTLNKAQIRIDDIIERNLDELLILYNNYNDYRYFLAFLQLYPDKSFPNKFFIQAKNDLQDQIDSEKHNMKLFGQKADKYDNDRFERIILNIKKLTEIKKQNELNKTQQGREQIDWKQSFLKLFET